MSEVDDVRSEIQEVKVALRKGGGYLGMSGETLQQYFLQLNKKENLLLAAKFRLRTEAEEDSAIDSAVFAGSKPAAAKAATATTASATGAKPPPISNGVSASSVGPVVEFNKEDFNAVTAHLETYKNNPREVARALRALTSIAYKGPDKIVDAPDGLAKLLSFMDLYPDDEAVQLAAIRVLCNVAYEPTIAKEKLSDTKVLGALMRATALHPESSKIGNQVNEAVARVVGAWGEETAGILTTFLGAVTQSEISTAAPAAKLLAQLTANEVMTLEDIAKQLVAAMVTAGDSNNAVAVTRSFELSKHLSMNSVEQQLALASAGVIQRTSTLMSSHVDDKDAQRTGIEAFSSLVGCSWDGLGTFAQVEGILRIETAMRAHLDEVTIQLKGLRALASGIEWPHDMRQKAKYDANRSIHLTVAAMTKHMDLEDPELLTAGLEALSKYLDRHCVDEFQANGAEGLVKTVMDKHREVQNIQRWGRAVLDRYSRSRRPSTGKNGYA